MLLTPFGELHDEYRLRLKNKPGEAGLFEPMGDWPKAKRAKFKPLMTAWLAEVADALWPAWQSGGWVGGSAANKEAAARRELELMVRLYQGGGDRPDILTEAPDVPTPPDGRPRTHKWHYEVEDALVHDPVYLHVKLPDASFDFRASQGIGSNYLAYDQTFPVEQFEQMFFGRMRRIEPPLWDIKLHFQRPRPWTAATVLGVTGFRWVVAGGFYVSHTGIHPAMLSGHCVQGILGGCNVYDALLETRQPITPERRRALQKYMVDFGDRRVFAGVHYMTDNIASWTIARKLIPHLFRHPKEVEAFAVEAITRHSRVFADVVQHFDAGDPALTMLLTTYPEAKVPVTA